jgi:hypothetical protein
VGRYYDYWFPPAAPRPPPVEGKARKQFGKTWWSQAWIENMERNATDNRASRGRAYARADRVYDIDIKPGRATGKVEGSSGEEYHVKLTCSLLKGAEKDALVKRLCKPAVAAPLLNNELAPELAGECSDIILKRIQADCSCPDYANPCKHIAALYYVLADEIDRAPQMLFNLRGLSNDEMLAAIKGAPGTARAAVGPAPPLPSAPMRRRGRPPKSAAAPIPARPRGRPPKKVEVPGPGRPRGRPPKDAASRGPGRPRGRPPKDAAAPTPGRRRGRPPKNTAAGETRRTRPKRRV